MLEKLESPENVLAYRAVGTIEKADYDNVLEPAVEAMVEARGEVCLVYVLGDEFEGYSVAAGWEDTKLGLGMISKWKRCAVATNHDWVRHMLGMFRWMMPGEVKVYDADDVDAAIKWAAG